VISYYKKSYIDKFWEFRERRDFFLLECEAGDSEGLERNTFKKLMIYEQNLEG